jgi:hypothetical protein
MNYKEMFAGCTFDIDKFNNLPKCTSAWFNGEAVCLLSAFWIALGFDIIKPVGAEKSSYEILPFFYRKEIPTQMFSTDEMKTALSEWANDLNFFMTRPYADLIVCHYDTRKPHLAEALLWQFIGAAGLLKPSQMTSLEEAARIPVRRDLVACLKEG